MADTRAVEIKQDEDAKYNRDLMARVLAHAGKIRVRVMYQVEDPQRKQFMALRGESFSFTAPSTDAVEFAMNRVVAALQRMK